MSSHHPSDDFLESYLFQHLRDPELAKIEEHLLFCSHCQHRTERTQEFLDVMSSACRDLGFEGRRSNRMLFPIEVNWKSLAIRVPLGVRWHGALAGVVLLVALNLAWLSSVRNVQVPKGTKAITITPRRAMALPSLQRPIDISPADSKGKPRAVRRRSTTVAKPLPRFIEFPPVAQSVQMSQALILLDPPPILVASRQVGQYILFEPVFDLSSTPPPKIHFARRAFRAVILPFRKIGELLVGL